MSTLYQRLQQLPAKRRQLINKRALELAKLVMLKQEIDEETAERMLRILENEIRK